MFQPTPAAAAVCALCASFAVFPAQAQTAAPHAPVQALSTVTVTATGYASETVATPATATVLDADALRRSAARSAGDALRGQPGLAVSADNGQGGNPVIRGLKKESVVLMVDGVRLNAAQPAGALASFMTLGLAEQVEVVHGPASVLYGTGALGGAVNVRLPQAQFTPGTRLRVHLGYDGASSGARGAAVFHAGSGDHAVMLGSTLSHQSDYRAGDGARVQRTGYDSRAFIGQYRFRVDARQQLRASVQQQRDSDVWFPGTATPHPHPAANTLTMVHSPRQERRLYEIGYQLERGARDAWGLDLRLYRQEVHRRIHNHAIRQGRDIVINPVTFTTHGADASAQWRMAPDHLLSFGLNVWQMSADPQGVQYVPPPTFGMARPNQPFRHGKLRAVGLFVQDDMQLGDSLRVIAGLRHDRVRGAAAVMNNGSVTSGLARTDSATSGSLAVMYEATALLRPYASVARGFRAADMRERFQSGPRQDGWFWTGSPQLAPETSTQFEIGLKGQDERLQYAVALYRNRITNYITGTQLVGPAAAAACGPMFATNCRQSINLGSVTLKGLDAGVRWQALPGHWFSASYSRVRGTNNDLGEPLYQMPADSLTLGWQGRIGAQWTADVQAHVVARQSRVARQFSRGTEDATPGYALLDVGANWNYRSGQSLRLAVRNLADRHYHEHLAVGLPGREVAAPGRSLQLLWNASF